MQPRQVIAMMQELERLRRENEALREENRQLRAVRLRLLLERAIQDDEMSQNITGMMSRYFPDPPAPWYVCILFFGNTPGKFPQEAPLDMVERAYRDCLSAFGQTCFFDASGMVACLLNISAPQNPDQDFYSRLQAALEEIFEETHTGTDTSHISISQPSQMEEGPKPLFRGALSASERRTASSPSVCVETLSAMPRQQDRFQRLTLEQTFWRQIQMREFYDSAVTLDQMIQLGQQERGTLDKTLASVFSRMELVLNATLTDQSPETVQDLENLLGSLSQVKSFQEMRDAAYDILATLEDQVYTPVNVRNRKMPSIEAYIQAHYGDQNLCANSIAEAFRISPSYLSRIFKSDRNMGLVEYIHRVRIDAAKVLLADPEPTLDNVAAKVGFSSRGVLNRVFKELEGMTPGAYRTAIARA